jgi:hypothetical protein
MKNRTDVYKNSIVTFLFLAVFTIFISGCKSTEVSPSIPYPNPPSAPAVAITLNGTVIDSKTAGGIGGATVEIYKTDGTKVTTIFSGASGKFSYDVSQVNATSLKVTATASGYGYAFTTASINLTTNTAQAVALPLDKLTVVSFNVTNVSGGSSNTNSTESKTSTPLTVSVPPGAVAQNTTIQLESIPVNNVLEPSNSSSSTQVSVANLQPAGISFSQPVQLTFPLPYKFNPGDQIQLTQMVNNNWQAAGISAAVDNSGYLAVASITQTGEYALLDNTKISGTTTLFKNLKVLDESSFSFTGGTLHTELPGVISYTETSANVVTGVPTDEWIFNNLAQRYGVEFAGVSAPGTIPYTVIFDAAWPGASANPNKQNADGSGNINRQGESGSWSLKITYESYVLTFANVVLDNPGYWQVTVNGSVTTWREKQRNWVWTAHNQGTVFEY